MLLRVSGAVCTGWTAAHQVAYCYSGLVEPCALVGLQHIRLFTATQG